MVIFAPHLPHEVIEQVLAARQASNAQTCFIVNDVNEMTLATKSQIANFGPNLAKMVDSEQFREKNVLELENSWAPEPGAFNSLCFLTIWNSIFNFALFQNWKMSERKVLNKYYPIDYDPRRLPRQKDRGQQNVIRFTCSLFRQTIYCLWVINYDVTRFYKIVERNLLTVRPGCGQYRGQNYGHSYYGTLSHAMQNLW